MKLKGVFEINDWKETIDLERLAIGKVSSATIEQTYQGDLIGTSHVYYQMYYSPNGDAKFTGFEIFEGQLSNAINEKLGLTESQINLVLKHDGQFKNGVASAKFKVIQSEQNESLQGLRGMFESTSGGNANFEIA
jgi:hypothetical protein